MGSPVDPDDDDQVAYYADLIRQAWRAAEVRRQSGRDPEDPAVLAASLMLNGHAVPREVRAGIVEETEIRERNRWAMVCARLSATIGGGSSELMDLRRRLLDDDTTIPGGVSDGEA